MDQLADIAVRSVGNTSGAGRILRWQCTYQADQQGTHICRAATHRRLGDTAAKGSTLFRRLLSKSAAQRICCTAALATRGGPAQALRQGGTG